MEVAFVLLVALGATWFFSLPTGEIKVRRRVTPLPSFALVTAFRKARRP